MHSRWYRSIKCRELMLLYYLAASPLCSPVHRDKGLTGILGPAGPARQKRVLTHSIWPPTLISMSTVKTLPLRRLGVDGEKKKKAASKPPLKRDLCCRSQSGKKERRPFMAEYAHRRLWGRGVRREGGDVILLRTWSTERTFAPNVWLVLLPRGVRSG